MDAPFIYITSKVEHAEKWRKLSKKYPLSCSWIWMDLDLEDREQMSQAWSQIIDDCRKSLVLIIYLKEGEQLKGGMVEIGAVLSNGGRIFSVGMKPNLDEDNRNFGAAITQFPDMLSALKAALTIGS